MFWVWAKMLSDCLAPCRFVWFVWNATMLGLGIWWSQIETCPAQPMLPIYMIGNLYLFNLLLLIDPPKSWWVLTANLFIVMGVAGILMVVAGDAFEYLSVIGCFMLGWLIYGSVIVFGMDSITYENQSHCQYSAYMFAYIATVFCKS